MSKTAQPISPVYVIWGQESFLRGQALEALLSSLDEAEGGGVQQTRMDGQTAELADVLDEVRTYSLLGGRRVVIVDGADPFITRHRKALERYCEAPANSGSLVLVCDSFPKNTRLYKIVSQTGRAIECRPVRGRAVVGWITRHGGQQYGKRVSYEAAARLRELTGDSLGELDSELAKLTIYVGDRPDIAPADIDKLVGNYREENVFALLDAMADGDTPAALQRWHQVLATDRAAQGRSVAGLAWGIRRLLEARRAWEAGASLGSLAGRMRTDPGCLRQRLERVETRQLEQRLGGLLAADISAKTSASAVDVAVEKWIIQNTCG